MLFESIYKEIDIMRTFKELQEIERKIEFLLLARRNAPLTAVSFIERCNQLLEELYAIKYNREA